MKYYLTIQTYSLFIGENPQPSVETIEMLIHQVMKGDPGTTRYSELTDKPKINGVTLDGNKSPHDLGLPTEQQLSAEVQRAQGAEQSLVDNLNAETQRAIRKETELEEQIAQDGKVDDVQVDNASVVVNKVAKLYPRIKGLLLNKTLLLELSQKLSCNEGNKTISVLSPSARYDAETKTIYL